MLERAMFVGQRYNLRRDDELALTLDVVTTEGAQALGLKDYGHLKGAAAIWYWWRPRLSPRRLHSGRGGARWSSEAA
jgi:hypothetical protein